MSEILKADSYFEAMKERLEVLQEPLGTLLLKGESILNDFGQAAPHPRDAPEGFPITVVSPMNVPDAKELSVQLSDARLVIDRNPPDFPSFPLRRVILWTPQGDGAKKRTEIKDISHQLPELPFDISVSSFSPDGNRHLGFIGYGYVDQEPHIEEVGDALDEAIRVCNDAFPEVVSGRIKTQQSIMGSETFWGIGIGNPENQLRR